jgi:RHS repeat-associated protein
VLCPAAAATTYTVTDLNDSDAGSLRAAIASAMDGDSIVFQTGLTGTISLQSTLSVTHNISINLTNITLSGNGGLQVLNINPGTVGTVTLTGGTITRGFAQMGGGIAYTGQTNSQLDITNTTITNNEVFGLSGQGGGVYVKGGTLKVTNCILQSNTALGGSSPGEGGAIYATGANLSVTGSNLSIGQATLGGGVYLDSGSAALFTNVSFNANFAGQQGSAAYINSGATASFLDCVINANASSGTAIPFAVYNNAGVATVNATSFAGNTGDGAFGAVGGINAFTNVTAVNNLPYNFNLTGNGVNTATSIVTTNNSTNGMSIGLPGTSNIIAQGYQLLSINPGLPFGPPGSFQYNWLMYVPMPSLSQGCPLSNASDILGQPLGYSCGTPAANWQLNLPSGLVQPQQDYIGIGFNVTVTLDISADSGSETGSANPFQPGNDKDANGNAPAGIPITATGITGNPTVNTNSTGAAVFNGLDASTAGNSTVTITTPGATSTTLPVSASYPPTQLAVISGGNQTVAPGATSAPVVVQALDVNGNPVPNIKFGFYDANFVNTSVTTDANGHASNSFTAGTAAGPFYIIVSNLTFGLVIQIPENIGIPTTTFVSPVYNTGCPCDPAQNVASSPGDIDTNTATGNMQKGRANVLLGGPMGAVLEVGYGSATETAVGSSSVSSSVSGARKAVGQRTSAVSAGAMGSNWMNNFQANLQVAGSTATVTLLGKQVQFTEGANSTWVLQGPQHFTYQLVTSAAGYQFLDPRTRMIWNFSSTGALASIQDRNGNTLTVTQGPNGPTSVSDGLGRSYAFTYNASGQFTNLADQTGRSVQFGYTGMNLTSFTDANGGVTGYTYAPSGSLMTSEALPAGNTPTTIAYNAQSQVQATTDAFQNVTSFAYNSNAGQTTITDARGNNEIDTYENGYALTQMTDAFNHSSSFGYDGSFRQTSHTDRLGNTSTATYLAAAGYPTSITDALGNTTTFTYTPQVQGAFTFYNLSKITFADGTSVSNTFDAFGNVLTTTDQAGNVTTLTYNSRGQVLTMTNPASGVITNTYNSDATLATSTDASGNTTLYAYDSLKRPVKATFADGSSVSTVYDLLDRSTSWTDERGGVTTWGYNANSDLTSVTDALNNSTNTVFDADDRVGSISDPLGDTTKPTYDPNSNIQSVTDAAGEKTSFSYDALNRLIKASDPAGFGPSFTYDFNGNVTGISDALSSTTTFVLDALGRVTNATTPLGEKVASTFDAMGRVTSFTDALSQSTSVSYESRGLPAKITRPLGIATSFGYDKLGLPASVTDPNGNISTYQNDDSGRTASMTDAVGNTTSYSYNARNWQTGISVAGGPEAAARTRGPAPDTTGGDGAVVGSAQITYDATGNPTQVQYSDGTVQQYTYDADNRLTTGNNLALGYDAAGNLTGSNGLTIARDAVGRIAGITYEPGKTVTYGYNPRGLLSQITDWAGGTIAFTYDQDARLVSMTRSNGVTTQYAYDNDSQVASMTEATSGAAPVAAALPRGGHGNAVPLTQGGSGSTLSSLTFQRDGNGNVTSATRNVPQPPAPAPGVNGFTYGAGEQVSSFSYDALGRVTQDSLNSYTWDLAGELTAYSGANGSASFVYDGFGMRVSSTSGGVSQSFVWNYALGLPSIATVQVGGADQRYYVYAPNGVLLYAIDAAGNVRHWYHFDETGSTLFLTNDAGQVTDTYGITPYGESVTATGNTPNPFKWLGEWGVMQEGVTDLYYMRARYYDGTSARFLSRDPVQHSDPQAMNPYQYAAASPLSRIDPTGAADQSRLGSILGAILGGGAATDTQPQVDAFADQWDSVFCEELPKAVETYRVRYQLGWFENVLDKEWWVQVTTWRDYLRIARPNIERLAALNTDARLAPEISRLQQAWARAEALGSAVGRAKSVLRVIGKLGFALVIGVSLIDGAAVAVRDYRSHLPVGLVASDAVATVGAGLTNLHPVFGLLNLATGGAAQAAVHNAVQGTAVAAHIAGGGRLNAQQMDAIGNSMRTNWATQALSSIGDYWANNGFLGTLSQLGSVLTSWR